MLKIVRLPASGYKNGYYKANTPVTWLKSENGLSKAKMHTVSDMIGIVQTRYAVYDTIKNRTVVGIGTEQTIPLHSNDTNYTRPDYCITHLNYALDLLDSYSDEEIIDMMVSVIRECIVDKTGYMIYAVINYSVIKDEDDVRRVYNCLEKALESDTLEFVHDQSISITGSDGKAYIKLPGKMNFPEFYN